MEEIGVLDLLESIYDDASEGQWQRWTDHLSHWLGQSPVYLFRISNCGQENIFRFVSHAQDSQLLAKYFQNIQQDPLYIAASHHPNKACVFDLATQCDVPEFYQKRKYRHIMMAVLTKNQHTLVLMVARRNSRLAFNPFEQRAIGQICQHLRKVIRFPHLLTELIKERLGRHGFNFESQHAVAVLNESGHPVFLNQAMHNYLAEKNSPFHIIFGKLTIDCPFTQKRLAVMQSKQGERANPLFPQQVQLGSNQLIVYNMPEQIFKNATLWQIR